jgi:hypothetical protein
MVGNHSVVWLAGEALGAKPGRRVLVLTSSLAALVGQGILVLMGVPGLYKAVLRARNEALPPEPLRGLRLLAGKSILTVRFGWWRHP